MVGCESDHHTLLFVLMNAVKRLPPLSDTQAGVHSLAGTCISLCSLSSPPEHTVWVLISWLVGGSFETAICILTR